MIGRAGFLAAMLFLLSCVGCVDRRFVIESNVPNAQVYIDNRPVGAAPAHASFEYYGDYTFTLVHPGYETKTERRHIRAPWYAYPPIDFLAEVVWPFHIRDRRHVYVELYEATKTRTDELLNAAESLRARGYNLPAPERPAVPRSQPIPQPIPQPAPAVPPVGPPVGPPGGPPIDPPGGPPPGIVPGVGPGM